MQDSTKDGSGSGDRRNWRERLGVGQDLPKISDEFKPSQTDSTPDQRSGARGSEDGRSEPRIGSHPERDAKPARGDGQPGAKPGTPVRPAPMAPRMSRPTAPQPAGDTSSGLETSASKPSEAKRFFPASPTPRPLMTPAQPALTPAESFRQPRPLGQAARPGASQPQASALSAARPGHSPRTSPSPAPQRSSAPSRGPAAHAHAHAQPGRSSAAPAAAGNDSFGERLRAQREAAERLAQQRLAAARDRSAHAGADTKTVLAQPEPNADAKPAGAEQPRFTFAHEEIVAAQRETAPKPEAQPAAGGHEQPTSAPPPYTPPNAYAQSDSAAEGQPGPGEAHVRMPPPYVPPHSEAGENRPDGAGLHPGKVPGGDPDLGYVARTPDYCHEDDAMFEDERPGVQAVPPRASAADYSAAYREFEDEFDEAPRRGGAPLFVLLSLLTVAVIFGGVIYWYLQLQGSPAPETADLPVITAPEDSAKADPEPQQQPQAAVQPTRRKQIYDRILGQETLEPERIVPTEEEPQIRQIQQQPPPRASGQGQSEDPGAGRLDQSTEPLPLPLPPPPGTGEQGDLLIPGMADTELASTSTEPVQLVLPEPVAQAARGSGPADALTSGEAAVQPAPREPARSSPEATARPETARPETTRPESSDTAAAASEAPVSQPIYPEPTSPLPYPAPAIPLAYPAPATPLAHPEVTVDSPPQEQTSEPDEATIAVLPGPEPEVEPGSAVPLPRTKPEPPPGVRTVTRQAPQAQPQRQRTAPPQPSGSGPVQITPTLLAPDQAPAAQQPQTQQPATAPSPPPTRTRLMGRDDDPLQGHRTPFSGSPLSESEPASRQLAGPQQPSPPAAPQQQVARAAPEQLRSQPDPAGGYVVQLASFRSESEALGEYQRLVQRYPQLVGGLNSRVQQASLGQSGTFYRLGVGPVADRNAATKLCNELIAAGEKDCLVRRN